jgi:amino acid adenylation domain-containing protein
MSTVTGADARARLAALLAERAARGEALFPLSHNQSSLWFLHQFAPETSAYSVGFAARVRGPLDRDRLAAALQALVDRHPALRTALVARSGRGFNEVRPPGAARLVLGERDASGWSDDDLARVVQEDYDRPFDLSAPPCFRASLYRRAGDDHVLLLVVHHAFLDLWALSIVVSELGALYAGKELAALPADYSTFARWQAGVLSSPAGAEHEAYWLRQLEGATTVLNLPTDRPRPPLQAMRGASVTFSLDEDVTAKLNALAREERTSAYALLLAAFQVLLARYTEQDDVLVGSPVAGRSLAELDGVVGHFVNMIVLRGRPAGDLPFRAYLRQVRDDVLGALEHQDYPFPVLVDRLQLARDPSRPPVFQACFAFQRAPKMEGLTGFLVQAPGAPPLPLGDLTMDPFPLSQQQGQFDLSLWMAEAEGRMHGEVKYHADLWDRPTAERMAAHLGTLLAGIVADPDARVAALPMLPEAERRLVVDEWNDTVAPWAGERLMHELFEEQAAKAPDAPAVACEGETLTYAELDAAANRLAHHLRSRGVGRGALVAVYMDRGLELVTALLGILKAGAGYVPLEPHYPRARVEVILSSLPIRAVVTHHRHTAALQELDAPLVEHLVCLDEGADPAAPGSRTVWSVADLAAQPATAPVAVSESGDTAYIIFTSGSTGTPKGVEVAHRPAINLIEWVNKTFGVGPGDRLLWVTSPCFDLSVYDVFGTLAAGGAIQVASPDEVRDPDRLVRLLAEGGITFWDSAPPALQQLVPFFPVERAGGSALRLVFLSGDWIPVRLPDQVRAVFPRAEVVSLGGATEATIWSNWYPIGEVEPHWVSIPYGKPIQNARYYVLDPSLQPCPIGVPGDLYIGGDVLAKGYVNDPGLTDSKFVPDPFVDAPGARMYRTGDRARFFPDGNLEFLGRQDFQVKIRGYRIELGEIEAVLSLHPQVAEALVMARADAGPERYLCAYVVPKSAGDRPAAGELRAFLRDRLPDYMVPAHFVVLDRMPITPNGKVDRKALPAPELSRDELGAAYVAPRGEVEEALAAIWARALGVDRVGRDDNFFDLGGHSLRAVQVVQEVEAAVGVRLAVSALLQAPTIADMAEAVGAGAPAGSRLVVPLAKGNGPPLWCIHPAGGEVLAYRPLAERLAPQWSVTGVQAGEGSSVDELADRYTDAIRAAQPAGPYRLFGWSMGGVLAHAVAARLEAVGEEVAFLGMLDSALPAENPSVQANPVFEVGPAYGAVAGLLAGVADDDRAALMERLLAAPADRRVAEALAWARQRGLLTGEVSPETVERQAELAAAHARLLAAHRAPDVKAAARVWRAAASPPHDWSAHVAGGVTESVLPGDHYSVVHPPAVDTLAEELAAALA